MKKKSIFILLGGVLLFVIVFGLVIVMKKTPSSQNRDHSNKTEKIPSDHSEKKETDSKEKEEEKKEDQDQQEEKTEDSKQETEKKEEPKKEESNEEKPSSPPSSVLGQENNQKRKSLESSYGLHIAYGNEEMYASHELIHTNDDGVIQNQLSILEEELAKYPYGFFSSFAKEGMPLSIFLVDQVVGRDIAGAADTSDATKPKLILTNRNFRETFHHEMMHCIDLYLRIMMYRDGTDPNREYETHNPSDFTYGNISYQEAEPGNPHFWFDYAKTSVEEDRAELFKAMMTVRSVLLKRGSLQQKGIVISRQLKTYFSISGRPYWEQSIDISL